jgi:hypothetical protein
MPERVLSRLDMYVRGTVGTRTKHYQGYGTVTMCFSHPLFGREPIFLQLGMRLPSTWKWDLCGFSSLFDENKERFHAGYNWGWSSPSIGKTPQIQGEGFGSGTLLVMDRGVAFTRGSAAGRLCLDSARYYVEVGDGQGVRGETLSWASVLVSIIGVKP